MDAINAPHALEIAVAVSFLLFAGAFWLVSLAGQWSLAPLERTAAMIGAGKLRLSLREMFLLSLQVQLAASVSLLGEPWGLAGGALASLAVVAVWWASLQRLASAHVVCGRRRAVFLGVVAPLVAAAIAAGLWFNGHAVLHIVTLGDFAIAPWLAGNFAAMGAFLICRRTTLWVLGELS